VPDVTVEPSGIRIAVQPGETLMAAAQRAGYRWPTVCEGQGSCAACVVKVLEGAEELLAASRAERERLAEVRKPTPTFRMACQLKITGGIRVEKRRVKRRPP
jgi:ferredoxin, 2Fe-2S